MSEEEKCRGLAGNPQDQYYYGTFQGVANYYPPQPPPQRSPHIVYGFPQLTNPHADTINPPYYYHGYQTVPTGQVHVALEGRPMRESRLPCCGMGMGWFLFIAGFFLGGIPWYVGAFVLLCAEVDYREKPGYVACVIASILAVIAITLGVTKGTDSW